MKKAYILSLGCPRNLLDSEVLLGLLRKKGLNIVDSPEGADVAIVNTCGFIQDAKQESIDYILQLAELKKQGKIKKLIIAGCLPQRYPRELMEEIEEIDGVFGTADFTKIPDMVEVLLGGDKVKEVSANPDFLYDHLHDRKILTSPHFLYLKIQEGCSNKCSYCVIPSLKGPRRSRAVDSVVKEVKKLKKEHEVKELVLIGQDTTSFGFDRNENAALPELLRRVSLLMSDGWVRLLYTHPAHFTEELMDVIAGHENICSYIDLPIQHINDVILKRMNRKTTKKEITAIIKLMREKIEGLTIRTSVIVGFPGESEKDFKELLDYLEEIRFDRLGAFIYSREEGTVASGFEDQIPEKVKKDRFDAVMKLQQKISAENNLKYIDKTVKVVIDEKDASGPDLFIGRSEMDAPEVDGVVYIKGKGLKVGSFADIKITGTMEYDLMGEVV